jgi:hypothetical protein
MAKKPAIKLEVEMSDFNLVMKAARRCVVSMVEHDILSESGHRYRETEDYEKAFKAVYAIYKSKLTKAKQ